MDIKEKKEYNRQWRLKNPDYNIKYGKKYRKSSNYELIKYKLRKSGFHSKKAAERKDYHAAYSKDRWKKQSDFLLTINTILNIDSFIQWKYIPKTAYHYAVSDSGLIFDCDNRVLITPFNKRKVLEVNLPLKKKILTLRVAYVVMKSFSKNKMKKTFWIEYRDNDLKNCSIFNLIRVNPIERLLASQFYKDIKSVNFSIWYYRRKFNKNLDFR